MLLRHQTGVATLIQFIAMAVLNFLNGIGNSIQGCTDGSGCMGSITINLLFFIIVSMWFGVLAVFGYAAQDRRSRRIAQLLLSAELLVLLVALFDARHYPNILGLITSLTDAALAAWVAVLAFRLLRAKGGRISPTSRARRSAAHQ